MYSGTAACIKICRMLELAILTLFPKEVITNLAFIMHDNNEMKSMK